MSLHSIGLVLALTVLSGLPSLQAQAPAAGAWARVDVLRPGTPIVVTLATGERRECQFVRSTADDLTLAFADGGEETLPKSLFIKVAGATSVHDSNGNGTAMGAVVGALAGLAVVSGMYAACDEGCEAPAFGGPASFSVAVGGGAGAAIGWAVDRSRKGEEILFERKPEPGL